MTIQAPSPPGRPPRTIGLRRVTMVIVAAFTMVGWAPESSRPAPEPAPNSAVRPAPIAETPPAPRAIGDARDAAAMPIVRSVPVVSASPARSTQGKPTRPPVGLRGWSERLVHPTAIDPRRRFNRTVRPADFGSTLAVGESFRFDVSFSGNPAGLAEAKIVALEPDPRGAPPYGAPTIRMEGSARTSGIVSLLATVTDTMVTYVDAQTGAALTSHNTLHYSGLSPRDYRHRETKHTYEGRGLLHIVDTKDDKVKEKLKRVPNDTFDPLSIMAWVRSLRLQPEQRAKAHVVDGLTLMRVEIVFKGPDRLDPMPSMVSALGLEPTDVVRIEGTMTRVDEYGAAIPTKKVFSVRAWLSNDERRIPLVMESDLWVGAIRLVLSGYDPPTDSSPGPLPAGAPRAR